MITAVRVYDHIINGHEQTYQSCRREESARKSDESGVNFSFSMNLVETRARAGERDKMLHLTSCGSFRPRRLMIGVSNSHPREIKRIGPD